MSTRTERFTVDRDAHVVLRLSRADVHVIETDGASEVVVELSGRSPEQVRVDHVGATVTVREEGSRFRSAVSHATLRLPPGSRLDVDVASGDVDVQVPVVDARLRTASGAITVDTVAGRGEIMTASGDIRLGAVDDATITAASGDVRIEHVRGACNVRSASGDVHLDLVQGDTDVKTASGDVEVAHLASRRLAVKTASGDTVVAVGPGRKVSFDFHSLSGDLHTRPPETAENADTPREPTHIQVNSLSGDLHLHAAPPRPAPPRP